MIVCAGYQAPDCLMRRSTRWRGFPSTTSTRGIALTHAEGALIFDLNGP